MVGTNPTDEDDPNALRARRRDWIVRCVTSRERTFDATAADDMTMMMMIVVSWRTASKVRR
jgi:hypothetical protein